MTCLASAEQGDLAAMDDVANMYADGIGAEPDVAAAQRWYASAVEKGSISSAINLALLLTSAGFGEDDKRRAFHLLENAVRTDEEKAAAAYAPEDMKRYSIIVHDYVANILPSVRASKGKAMHMLGRLMVEGVGTDPDPAGGVKWMEQAVALGCAEAAYELGVALWHGKSGISIDRQTSIAWFRRAADLGHAEAAELVKKHFSD